MNPRMSLRRRVGSFPQPVAILCNVSAMDTVVFGPQIISRKGVVKAGSAQCIPRKRPGCLKVSCRMVIGMAEVLVVIIALSETEDSIKLYTFFLMSTFSTTHSEMRKQSFRSL